MNWDRIEGKWEQAKGELKTKWNKLTDDDLGAVAGKRDQLVGKLQERYGILKDDAERQIDAWVSAFDGSTEGTKAGAEDLKHKAEARADDLKSKAESKAGDLKTKAEHTVEDLQKKVAELKDKAMDVAQDLKARALDVAQDAAYKVDELVSEQRQAGAQADKGFAKPGEKTSAKKPAPTPRSSNPDL